MRVVAFDDFERGLAKECGFSYVSFDELLAQSDVISLHLPEMPETHHIINKNNVKKIKKGCILLILREAALLRQRLSCLA